ncbi:unnamed protein product [Linum trigynum]|uniref:Uncharacterized protein n=1 Tax=Linum trigynum TaxID=586398 RepID=A0AAV2D3T5_9ROSI
MRKKNVSLLKSGIQMIGSFCSRTRSDMLKKDQEETDMYLFDDDHDDDGDSCLWLSSSASPSSFFDEGSSCCSSFVLEESAISSEISSSSSREVVVDLASWVSELEEEDATFLADLDLEYCCIPSNFPSPSFSTCCSSHREAGVMEEASELEQLDDDDDDDDEDEQALFWPFDEGKLRWNRDETWISFTMSPRKDIHYSSEQATAPSKCLESKQKTHDHHRTMRILPKLKRISSLLPRMRMSSTSDSKPAAATRRAAAAAANKVMLPSKLVKASESSSFSTKALVKVVPLEVKIAKNRMDHGATDEACLFGSIIGRDEVPIEKVMGLEEFDGHEGMDSSQLDDDLINGDDSLFSLAD